MTVYRIEIDFYKDLYKSLNLNACNAKIADYNRYIELQKKMVSIGDHTLDVRSISLLEEYQAIDISDIKSKTCIDKLKDSQLEISQAKNSLISLQKNHDTMVTEIDRLSKEFIKKHSSEKIKLLIKDTKDKITKIMRKNDLKTKIIQAKTNIPKYLLEKILNLEDCEHLKQNIQENMTNELKQKEIAQLHVLSEKDIADLRENIHKYKVNKVIEEIGAIICDKCGNNISLGKQQEIPKVSCPKTYKQHISELERHLVDADRREKLLAEITPYHHDIPKTIGKNDIRNHEKYLELCKEYSSSFSEDEGDDVNLETLYGIITENEKLDKDLKIIGNGKESMERTKWRANYFGVELEKTDNKIRDAKSIISAGEKYDYFAIITAIRN